MSVVAGRREKGLMENGSGLSGSNKGFSAYTWYTADSMSGDGCFAMSANRYGSGVESDYFTPVDTSKSYIFSASLRTYELSYNGRLGSGHIGFACYDQFKNFIDLRNCGDVGNTYLSRQANPGDTKIYITDATNWYQGADVTANTYYYRQILFFPASHPYYGQPHKYTRFNGHYYSSLVQTAQGDWEMTIQNGPLTDYGYALPAGTPISRGVAGGSYNYALGNPNYPTTWTTYTTPVFTGENRNSAYPFRYSTKYIRWLNLCNYNYRTETAGNSAHYLLDNVMLIEAPAQNSSKLTKIRNDGKFTKRKRQIR